MKTKFHVGTQFLVVKKIVTNSNRKSAERRNFSQHNRASRDDIKFTQIWPREISRKLQLFVMKRTISN